MGTTVEELDYELNFKWDKKTFSKFNESLKKSIAGFAKLGAAITAAQGVAFAIAKNVADQNDQLAKLAPRLNTTTEEYQKLKFAAEDFGASGEDVTSSLKSLTKAQEDVLRGKGDIEAFGRLGINPADFENSADLLLAIGDSIQGIQSNSEKIDLLERIGVSPNLLQALESGSTNIDKLGKRFAELGGVVTEEQKRLAGEFQKVWLEATTVINGIMGRIGSKLLVSINKFLETFVTFAVKNMQAITHGFNIFFETVNKVSQVLFGILQRIFTMFTRVIGLFGGLENTILAVAAAFVILKRRMVASFVIPLALATALFLVIEDMFSALEGKESVFKDIFGNTGVEVLVGFVNLITESIKGWGLLLNNWEVALEGLMILIREMAEDLSNLVSFNLPSFGDIGTSISGLFGTQQPAQAITNNNGGAKNANVTINVSGASGSVVDEINQYFQQSSNRIFGE